MTEQAIHDTDTTLQTDSLSKFHAWATWCHHYTAIDAISRFRALEEADPAAIDHIVQQAKNS